MRIDVHTHVFPDEMVRERHRFFHGEPAFRLLYDSPKARLARAEDLLEVMERDGVDFAVTFGFPWRSMELAERHNDYVLESAAKYAPRLVPLGCVDPINGGASAEARRCLDSGARGLGELAVYGTCDEENALMRFQELMDCCRAYEAVMMVHANEPVGHMYPGKAPLGLDFFYRLAAMAEGLPLILAHWGGGLCFYELLKREAREVLASVHYDTAASPFVYKPGIYGHLIEIVGKSKILMGSDYPLLPPKRYFDEMSEAGVGVDAFDAIAGQNAARLFDLPSAQ